MSHEIEGLLGSYESGKISRRHLVASLSALAAVPSCSRSQSSALRVSTLNHVTIMVSDVERSVQFYRNLFGLSVMSRQENGVNLAVGDAFLGIYDRAALGIDSQIHHVCFGIDGFDVSALMNTLESEGLEGTVRMREETVPEVYFQDPDGLTVQLQDVTYCGGTGSLGNVCP